MANYAVSLVQLNRLSRLQPGFQAAGLAELTNVHGKHGVTVPQELLSGIKDQAQFDKLKRALDAFRDEPLATPDYEQAARMYNVCRGRGLERAGEHPYMCGGRTARMEGTGPRCQPKQVPWNSEIGRVRVGEERKRG